MKTEYRKGMYFATRTRSAGGDVPVGVIMAVPQAKRGLDRMMVRILTTGWEGTRSRKDLDDRHYTLRKIHAMQILAEYRRCEADGMSPKDCKMRAQVLSQLIYAQFYKDKPTRRAKTAKQPVDQKAFEKKHADLLNELSQACDDVVSAILSEHEIEPEDTDAGDPPTLHERLMWTILGYGRDFGQSRTG